MLLYQKNHFTCRPNIFEHKLFDNDVPELVEIDMIELFFELVEANVDEASLDFLARVERDLFAVGLNARVEKSQVAFLFGHVGDHLAEFGRDASHECAREEHDREADRGGQCVVKVARLGHRDELVRDEHDVEQRLGQVRVKMYKQLDELVHVFGHVLIDLGCFRLTNGDLIVYPIFEVELVSSLKLLFIVLILKYFKSQKSFYIITFE